MELPAVLLLSCFVFLQVWCKDIDTRIVGGAIVSNRSEFAYQALLLFNNQPYCGASIINSSHVLTAAHCLYSNGKKLNTDDIAVAAGQLYIKDFPVRKRVSKAYIHENYRPEDYSYDIAVIKISGTFGNWTDKIKPIKLATTSVSDGFYCTISGWGTTRSEEDYMSSQLRYVSVPIVNWSRCRSYYYGSLLDNRMICAGTTGKDSCQGDSGGPMVCNGTLTGIVSYGYECAKAPGVYTEVAKYLDWIQKRSSAPSNFKVSIVILMLCLVYKLF